MADANNPTFPGIYIQEVPSQVRTIAGTPTSITAFIGRALRGPVDEPVTIFSYADFERKFGGLWIESFLGYSVQDFFQNGGAQAIVVRVYKPDATGTALVELTNADDSTKLTVLAANQGAWGNKLRVFVEVPDPLLVESIAATLDVEEKDIFNLRVGQQVSEDEDTVVELEAHLNLTMVESARRVDRVIGQFSKVIQIQAAGFASDNHWPTVNEVVDGKRVWTALEDGSDGVDIDADSFTGSGQASKRGLYALESADLFNLLYIPPYGVDGSEAVDVDVLKDAATYCAGRRAVLVLDSPVGWTESEKAVTGASAVRSFYTPLGTNRKNAALYFPWLRKADPLRDHTLADFPPGGSVLGIIARTDASRGVWKAPAGVDAGLTGPTAVTVPLTDDENGQLNPQAINCIRNFPGTGFVVWGARTLLGDDLLASEWKYLPVRRLALYIEESLYRGTRWIVFEPNDEPLWAQIRLNIGSFMHTLFRKGAFQGQTPKDAYLVKCDKETTTQDDIDRGIVNILVGFAPLKPAEFVIIRIQQLAAQAKV